MKLRRRRGLVGLGFAATVAVVIGCWFVAPVGAQGSSSAGAADELHVGLRRSSYGLPKKNGDHAWWAERAREFAGNFPGARATIIQIVSGYREPDGTTAFEFAKPQTYQGPVSNMSFAPGKLDHEKALTEYDAAGVQAILQVEPGSADMVRTLEIVHLKFGRHPCVIGFGVDAEWYFTKDSTQSEGRAITDDEARTWMEKVLSFNPRWVLFLKHWEPSHMPPTYRHPQLLFISDSQDFTSRAELVDDFREWARHFKSAATGYQFGYPKDRRWWSRMKKPAVELAREIRAVDTNCRYLFWVDFTADAVEFK